MSQTGAIKQQKIIHKDVIEKDTDKNIKLIVNIRIDIAPETWGWWLEVYVDTIDEGESGGLPVYQDTIFTDGRGCYERLPSPSVTKFSRDITKHIKEMFSVWLERSNVG